MGIGAVRAAHVPPAEQRLHEDFIKILKKESAMCEASGDFQRAFEARMKLRELRLFHQEELARDMHERHERERKEALTQQESEMAAFRDRWQQVEWAGLEAQILRLQETLRERQTIEYHNLDRKLTAEKHKARPTVLTLKMRKQMEVLGRMGEHTAAHKLKKRVERIESAGLEKAHLLSLEAVERRKHQLLEQQQREQRALDDRIGSMRAAECQQEAAELESLHRHHRTMWQNLTIAHGLEKKRLQQQVDKIEKKYRLDSEKDPTKVTTALCSIDIDSRPPIVVPPSPPSTQHTAQPPPATHHPPKPSRRPPLPLPLGFPPPSSALFAEELQRVTSAIPMTERVVPKTAAKNVTFYAHHRGPATHRKEAGSMWPTQPGAQEGTRMSAWTHGGDRGGFPQPGNRLPPLHVT
ncbi:unnamed protein product [Vitrella brassicaformis CCMP3155]|uniref:Uncharacterized protein n=3 Tax=Vitrella brassicaformis TaxID=1169539 RepID=A0A0G4E9G4_VITBC|nr:unnamed protein product [Vitrella brassicaformis CCMP3155]|eukprot:CEL92517.1 unnamed protein product [Vitrella brassicaformis CCMP3155]